MKMKNTCTKQKLAECELVVPGEPTRQIPGVLSHVGCSADHCPPAVGKEAIRQVRHAGVRPVRPVSLWRPPAVKQEGHMGKGTAEHTSLNVHWDQTCVNAAMMIKMQSPMWNT